MSRIQTDRVLPPELTIESIDDILYSIGLCHHSVREIPKRSVINKPLIITLLIITQFLLRVISNTTKNKEIILLTADIGHFMGIKELINHIFILCFIMTFMSLIVYYYNHSIGVKPTFVRVFQVLSGSITPSSVGLNNPTQVKRLLKIAKWLPLLKKNNTILLPLMCSLIIFGLHYSFIQFYIICYSLYIFGHI